MQGSWALLLGMLFLQLGNGLQGTLLSVREELEDFSTFEMSVVMSAIGFISALTSILVLDVFLILVGSAFLIGGMSNPLYSLLIAYTNDF